jgi:hypothetical protein
MQFILQPNPNFLSVDIFWWKWLKDHGSFYECCPSYKYCVDFAANNGYAVDRAIMKFGVLMPLQCMPIHTAPNLIQFRIMGKSVHMTAPAISSFFTELDAAVMCLKQSVTWNFRSYGCFDEVYTGSIANGQNWQVRSG